MAITALSRLATFRAAAQQRLSAVRGAPPWTAGSLLLVAGLFRVAQNMGQTTFSLLGRDRLGLGSTAIGSLGAVVGVFALTSTLVVGTRFPSAKAFRAVRVGVILLTAALAVFGASTSAWQFTAGAVLLGVAGGTTTPSLATAVAQTSPAGRDRALARYTVVLSLSLVLGPLFETGLLTATGQQLRLVFFIFVPLPLIALVLGIGWRSAGTSNKTAMVERTCYSESFAYVSASTTDATEAPPVGGSPGPIRLRSLLATSGGRMGLTVQLLYAVPFSEVTVFGALVARSEFKMSAAGAQFGFTLFFATSLLSRLLVARLSPIKSKRRVFISTAVLTVAGTAMLGVLLQPPCVGIQASAQARPQHLTIPHTKDFAPDGGRLDSALAADFAACGLEFATSWAEVRGRLGL